MIERLGYWLIWRNKTVATVLVTLKAQFHPSTNYELHPSVSIHLTIYTKCYLIDVEWDPVTSALSIAGTNFIGFFSSASIHAIKSKKCPNSYNTHAKSPF